MSSIANYTTRKITGLFKSSRWYGRSAAQFAQSTITTDAPTFDDLLAQVNRYRSWMITDVTENAHPSHRIRAEKHVEDALKTVVIGGREIRSFAPFRRELSALQTLTTGQVIFLGISLLACLLGLLSFGWQLLIALMALITIYYLGNAVLTFTLSAHMLDHAAEAQISDAVVHALADADWPTYTILCPLYREVEVVPQFVAAMQALDYPPNKLQILFLTEEDDEATREAIRSINLPALFEIITVPDGTPRTKPRACNYGLLKATGDYVVIYDAEDIPDPLQLKKAILTFANHGADLGCVQAKLNFYNTEQNILTRWFTIEYSTWFEMVLPGLQWAGLSLPLGGTSNHFRTRTLHALGVWDVFNVTEDCDLGLRLARFGLNTVVLDSTTYEEANPHVKGWIRQRSRWIKGYLQTYLVHMRRPQRVLSPHQARDFFSLQFIIGGRTLVLLLNPIMWALLLIYILFRPIVEHSFHTLFPAPVLYMATICLFFGNVLYVYTHFVGCTKRNQPHLVKWCMVMPIYWAMSSWAAFIAVRQLITNPHYWEKTSHGLHLKNKPASGKSTPEVSGADQAAQNPLGGLAAVAVERSVPEITSLSRSMSLETLTGYSTDQIQSTANTHRHPVHRMGQQTWLWLTQNPWLVLTFVTACILSTVSVAYFFQNHELLLYGDANAHLSIARRVIDNATPGLAQLGGIWLPLQHLAMMPFVQNNYLWSTGLAGSLVSMPCYIVTAIYLFLSAQRLTKNNRASFVGTLLFMLNPNILYLQSTALSELMLIAVMTMACYYFLAWVQDGSTKQLILAAAVTFAATLTRYDGWPLFLAFCVLIVIVGFIKQQRWPQIESALIIFVTLGGLGIALWLLWCTVIFGDPLYFLRSEYSAQAMQKVLISANRLYTYHDLWQSIRYFSIATIATLGPSLFALGLLASIVFILRNRLSTDGLVALAFFVPCAFYVFSFYSGQAVMYVPGAVPTNASESLFNARYAAVTVVPAGLFLATLLSYLTRMTLVRSASISYLRRILTAVRQHLPYWACIVIITGQTALTVSGGVIMLQSGQFGVDCSPGHAIIMYLAQYYTGGKVLRTVASSKIDTLDPLAGIDFSNVIYEGSGALWKNALDQPAPNVDWIVMNSNNPDDVLAKHLDVTNPIFQSQFTRVVEEKDGLSLFSRNQQAWLPTRAISPALVADFNARSQCKS